MYRFLMGRLSRDMAGDSDRSESDESQLLKLLKSPEMGGTRSFMASVKIFCWFGVDGPKAGGNLERGAVLSMPICNPATTSRSVRVRWRGGAGTQCTPVSML